MSKTIKLELFNAKSASELSADKSNFYQYFEHLMVNSDLEGQTKFLGQFFSSNPMFKSYAIEVYIQCMLFYGNSKLALEACRVAIEATKRVADVGQNLYKLPLINTHGNFNMRIGELFDQGASTVLQMQLGKIDAKPVLPLPPDLLREINSAALPYLEDCYDVVTDERELRYYGKYGCIAPYTPYLYKYSDSQYGHNSYFSLDCHYDIVANNINPYPFQLKDITIDQAMRFLKQFGVKLDDKFVVLHLREEGYIDGDHHFYRNTNPQSYISAVKYLLSQGLKVIRIGHAKMTYMFKQVGFLDLTQVSRPDEVDLFLAGKAQFYFGSASGPSSVSYQFGVPCCLIGMITQGVRSNNFAQFMQLKRTATGEILTLDDLETLSLKDITAEKPLTDRGLIPIAPQSDMNAKFAREALEYYQKGRVFKINEQYESQRIKHKILGGLCTNSLYLLD